MSSLLRYYAPRGGIIQSAIVPKVFTVGNNIVLNTYKNGTLGLSNVTINDIDTLPISQKSAASVRQGGQSNIMALSPLYYNLISKVIYGNSGIITKPKVKVNGVAQQVQLSTYELNNIISQVSNGTSFYSDGYPVTYILTQPIIFEFIRSDTGLKETLEILNLLPCCQTSSLSTNFNIPEPGIQTNIIPSITGFDIITNDTNNTSEIIIDGKLTVTGGIDPSYLQLMPNEDKPNDVPPDMEGVLWVKDNGINGKELFLDNIPVITNTSNYVKPDITISSTPDGITLSSSPISSYPVTLSLVYAIHNPGATIKSLTVSRDGIPINTPNISNLNGSNGTIEIHDTLTNIPAFNTGSYIYSCTLTDSTYSSTTINYTLDSYEYQPTTFNNYNITHETNGNNSTRLLSEVVTTRTININNSNTNTILAEIGNERSINISSDINRHNNIYNDIKLLRYSIVRNNDIIHDNLLENSLNKYTHTTPTITDIIDVPSPIDHVYSIRAYDEYNNDYIVSTPITISFKYKIYYGCSNNNNSYINYNYLNTNLSSMFIENQSDSFNFLYDGTYITIAVPNAYSLNNIIDNTTNIGYLNSFSIYNEIITINNVPITYNIYKYSSQQTYEPKHKITVYYQK